MIQKIFIVPDKYYQLLKQCLIFVVQNPNSSRSMSKFLYPRFMFWPSNLGVALPPPNSFVSHMRPKLAKSGGGPASRTPCGSSGSSAETPSKPSCLAPPAPADSPCGKKPEPKPSQYPVKPQRRMEFKNDRFFNFMFSKHVIMHHYAIIPLVVITFGIKTALVLYQIIGFSMTRPEVKWTTKSNFPYQDYDLEKPWNHKSKIIPLVILSFGTNIALLLFQLTRNTARRPEIKWRTKSNFPYQNYDLEEPWNHRTKIFNYFQQYVPFPDLKKLYGIMKEAKAEYEEEERKKKEAEELEAANVAYEAEVARAAEEAKLALKAEKAQAAEAAREAKKALAAEKARAAEEAKQMKEAQKAGIAQAAEEAKIK